MPSQIWRFRGALRRLALLLFLFECLVVRPALGQASLPPGQPQAAGPTTAVEDDGQDADDDELQDDADSPRLAPLYTQRPRRTDGGNLALGIGVTVAGFAGMTLGTAAFLGSIASMSDSGQSVSNSSTAMAGASGLMILGGAALLVGGIKLIVRSRRWQPPAALYAPRFGSSDRSVSWETLTIRF